MTNWLLLSDSGEDISTHTPLAGRDGGGLATAAVTALFLLTRPSRDVTNGRIGGFPDDVISTHTPLAGRDPGKR